VQVDGRPFWCSTFRCPEAASRENEDSFHVRVLQSRLGDPMPLKLCQGSMSCRNYGAILIESKWLCVSDAATQDLGRLLREKTPDQLSHLARCGCGELPPWARFGIARGVVQGPEPKRGRGRPRKWLNANQRWWAWRLRNKGWIPKKRGRRKSARWTGVDDRTRNSILNRELRSRRKKQALETAAVTFVQFCIEEERLRVRRRRRGLTT
jgi:hypothetical protein